MPDLAGSALRLLRRLLGTPGTALPPGAGEVQVLDGNTAVALTEAAIAEAAGLGAGFPARGAELGWRGEQRRRGSNQFGAPLAMLGAEGPRGTLAATLGLAMSGVRATAFLSGPDLAACRDLLGAAVGRRLPLVVHLVGRALPAQGAALGGGHEALHLAAEAGALVLVAANVQEAVDFALIARQAAELGLVPAVVAMDAEETALAAQDVRLPAAQMLEALPGRPEDPLPSPTPAQQLLFGTERRRLPRWHDPDRPATLGALQPPETYALGRAASDAFLSQGYGEILAGAFETHTRLSGRRHRALSAFRTEGARVLLVALGSAIETAEAVADHLRGHKVGVLGIRALVPFPAEELLTHLKGAHQVLVLERTPPGPGGEGPLLTWLRAALDRAGEAQTLDPQARRDASRTGRPRLVSLVYGLGGWPLRAADLIALVSQPSTLQQSRIYLGMGFSPSTSRYPKRQVLLDRLRRAYPEAAALGLQDPGPPPDLRPSGARSLAIYRRSGGEGEGLLLEAGLLLAPLFPGGLRSRPALFAEPWGAPCRDHLTLFPAGARDPGADCPLDLAFWCLDPDPQWPWGPEEPPPAALLVESNLDDAALWARLPEGLRRGVGAGGSPLYRLDPPQGDATRRLDQRLGALCAVLLGEGRLPVNRRRLLAARETQLRGWVADPAQRLEDFAAGLDGVGRLDPATLAAGGAPAEPILEDEAPTLVRQLGTPEEAYDDLPRFWDQVGVLHRGGQDAELAPDPYLGLGAMPPLTASFRDLAPLGLALPDFDPERCTACGVCWSACPEGAVAAKVLSPERVLGAAVRRPGGEALRPLVGRIAGRVAALCRSGEGLPDLAALLRTAVADLRPRLSLPEDRLAALDTALARLIEQLGCLPVAAPEGLHGEGPGAQPGADELLWLAVDPATCKGCGLCVRHCEPGALTAAEPGQVPLARARQVRTAWEQLPPTEAASCERLAGHPQVGSPAAELLASHAAQRLAGGDGSEPGSGERLALRLAVTLLGTRQRTRLEALLGEVRGLRQRIRGLIRSTLADALPSDDLDALADGLAGVGTRQAELRALIAGAEGPLTQGVDTARLRRLVELGRGLAELEQQLAGGRGGLGRAGLGLMLSPGSPVGWTGAFPHTPFAEPVTLDPTGDGALMAAGLLEGQLRQATAGFILLRKARLELDQPGEAIRQGPTLDGLTWRDLAVEERGACPALLLVGDSGSLAGPGLAQLAWLLAGPWPVKVLLLAELDLGLATPAVIDAPLAAAADPRAELGLLMLAHRDALIAQTSLGAPRHFSLCLAKALDHPGPALLQVHAPAPRRDGFAPDQTLLRAQAAVTARAWLLFLYDPAGEGVFGSRIDLSDNPDPAATWGLDPGGAPWTLAHWALGEDRFAHLFSPLAEGDPAPLPLSDYLDRPPAQRVSHTPFVERSDQAAAPERLRVDAALVAACERRLQAWRMLQELAGLVTPFTSRVEQAAEERVAAARTGELQAQAVAFEARLQGLRGTLQEETRQAVRERLMQLAGYRPTPAPPARAAEPQP